MGSKQSRLNTKINDLKIMIKEQKEGIEIFRRESVSSRKSITEFPSPQTKSETPLSSVEYHNEFQSFYNGQSYFYGFEMVSKRQTKPDNLVEARKWHKMRSKSIDSGID